MSAERVNEDEFRLILLARQGDREAYGALAARHYAGVIQVVYRMCGEPQLAEDAAQEAFIRAWLKLGSFQPKAAQAPASFRNWLYRIAMNAALDVLRRKPAASIDDVDASLLADPALGPEAALLQKEQSERVQAAVQALPEGARAVVVLREYSGLSYQEISDVLDIPVGTVMSRLNYARTKLRDALEWYPAETEREHD